MAKALNILFVSSEVYPFSKEGGLADVAFSLPLALRDLGHDVRVMMPKYGAVSERKNKIHDINRLKDIPIPVGANFSSATVKSSSMQNPRNKVQAYITTNQEYFDAIKGIYVDPATGQDYPNNAERFIFFNRSVIETCMTLEWFPDIVHVNDWQTGILPALIKLKFNEKFKKTKIVLTIHNIARQGEFPIKEFPKTHLPDSAKDIYKFKNKFNFLKGSIQLADFVTTVSPSYAEECLRDKAMTNGLSELLKEKRFKGIFNGIDPWTWNPEEDTLIVKQYEDDFEDYKYSNKIPVLKAFGFEYKPKTPLIGMISAINETKGTKLFLESAEKLLKENVQVAFLGRGDAALSEELMNLSKKKPDKFKVLLQFRDDLAHQIEAGSDMFLMTPLREPCGLNFMYSSAYGTIPIVTKVSGLKDIVREFDTNKMTGNAFIINELTPDGVLSAVKRALEAFKKKDLWQELAMLGMEADYSWKGKAEQYVEIYRSL